MNQTRPPPQPSEPTRPVLYCDIKKYAAMLGAEGVSEEDCDAFVQAFWSLVVTCIDFGWNVHPLPENCGQADLFSLLERESGADMVKSKSSTLTHNFTSRSAESSPVAVPPLKKGA